MDKVFLCADLYDAAFLLSYGAKFKRIESFYRNHQGKSFSVMSLTDVTWEMLELLQDKKATVEFQKLKMYRKRIKKKAEKYASENEYTEISSTEIYKIHQKLRKQLTEYKKEYSSTGPKRIMQEDNNEPGSISAIPFTSMGS